jgi:hypothetical protein
MGLCGVGCHGPTQKIETLALAAISQHGKSIFKNIKNS